MLIFMSVIVPAYALENNYDVIIAGAGTGGIAAAFQASSMGMDVLIIEPSSMIGGQAIAAGVSTMDDGSEQESGFYKNFMSRVENYYLARGKDIKTPYWDMIEKGFEPHVGEKILKDMLKGEYAPDILLKSEIVNVCTENIIAVNENGMSEKNCVKSVIVKTPDGMKNIACKILIEATEYGDVLPLAGAEYRVGNSISPNVNLNAMIQDITWAGLIRKYPDGIPEHLRPKNPLPGYDYAKWNYEKCVTRDGNDYNLDHDIILPVSIVVHNSYRAVPDSFSNVFYNSEKGTWPLVTKTGINWGNDYPGQMKWNDKYGLPVEYLENKNLRKRVERDALIKTLHYIYYIQNELGENWSVDENEYGELQDVAQDLPDEWKIIARHFPPIAYVRESRRGVGEYVLTSTELYKNSLSYQDDNGNNEFYDAIAIGRYNIDLHNATSEEDVEKDLGEKEEFFFTHNPTSNFQVPLRILIPKNIDGLILAEKNLSMSRHVAGALRLQPITMMTGQAAGALAAVSILKHKQPREIKAINVQKELLNAGVNISLRMYSDVDESDKFYGSVQLANLYNLFEIKGYKFEPNKLLEDNERKFLIERVKTLTGVDFKLPDENMTRGEALDFAIKFLGE